MDFKLDHSFKYNTKNGSKMGKVFERCDPSFHFEKPLHTADLISHYPLFLVGKDFYLPNDVFTILFEVKSFRIVNFLHLITVYFRWKCGQKNLKLKLKILR